jgi:hypothetical protein
LTRSRTGLSSSSSSTTYAPVVPSENVTISPSSPSCFVVSIRIATAAIERMYSRSAGRVCIDLLISLETCAESGHEWRAQIVKRPQAVSPFACERTSLRDLEPAALFVSCGTTKAARFHGPSTQPFEGSPGHSVRSAFNGSIRTAVRAGT